jgi:undecaprenyl-diphosphatase
MLDHLLALDKALFLFLNRDLTSPVFDTFFTIVTNGNFWIIPGITAALLVLPRLGMRRAITIVVLSMCTLTLTDQLATSLIKPLVARLRPCNPHALVEQGRFLLGYKTSFSFPSNHAMNMFGQAMLLALFYRRYSAYFFLFASIIAYSRVYVGVHYPLDIACGAIFGMICGAAVFGGYRAGSLLIVKYRKKQDGQGLDADAAARNPMSG